jgi:hypothetical protein
MATRYGFAERAAFGAYVEAALQEHHRWQHAAEYALIKEVIYEVQQLPKCRPQNGRLFDLAPAHLREMVIPQ